MRGRPSQGVRPRRAGEAIEFARKYALPIDHGGGAIHGVQYTMILMCSAAGTIASRAWTRELIAEWQSRVRAVLHIDDRVLIVGRSLARVECGCLECGFCIAGQVPAEKASIPPR